MAALDRTKEEIAYLRFWQGIVVVTDISLVGWSASSFGTVPTLTAVLAATAVVLLTTVAMVLHKQIGRSLNQLGDRGWKH